MCIDLDVKAYSMEIWKDVPNHEEEYEVSDMGRIRNKQTGALLTSPNLSLGKDKYLAARLIADLFVPKIDDKKRVVVFLNGDKNDRRACNLAWFRTKKEIEQERRETEMKDLDGEEWKTVEDYTRYEVSNKGRIRNKERNALLTGLELRLEGKGSKGKKVLLSHLVAKAFLPAPPVEKRCMVYKDGDINNVAADNLEWGLSKKDVRDIKIEQEWEKRTSEHEDEQWKAVEGYDDYEVSTMGRVRNVKTKKYKSPHIHKDNGYVRVMLGKKMFNVHVLVAITFIPNPDGKKTVNHIDKNRQNNNIKNLEWASHSEQAVHCKNFGEKKLFERSGKVQIIERVDLNTGNVIEEYSPVKAVCVWILKNVEGVKNIETQPNIHRRLHLMAISFNKKLRNRAQRDIDFIEHGFLWRVKQPDVVEGEVWNKIPPKYIHNTDDGWEVSSIGRIRNKDGRIASNTLVCGYYNTSISGHSYKTHRLVALTFIPNPLNKQFVNHKDGDKLNNRLENLEFVSNQENTQHAIDTGLRLIKRAVVQYDKDGSVIREFSSVKEAKETLGIAHVSDVCSGKAKHSQGYIFRYKGDPPPQVVEVIEKVESVKTTLITPKRPRNRGRAVVQCDEQGNVIREFSCIKDAEETLGVGHVGEVCNGTKKHTKSMFFRFKE